jgi:hypothetical protein
MHDFAPVTVAVTFNGLCRYIGAIESTENTGIAVTKKSARVAGARDDGAL